MMESFKIICTNFIVLEGDSFEHVLALKVTKKRGNVRDLRTSLRDSGQSGQPLEEEGSSQGHRSRSDHATDLYSSSRHCSPPQGVFQGVMRYSTFISAVPKSTQDASS